MVGSPTRRRRRTHARRPRRTVRCAGRPSDPRALREGTDRRSRSSRRSCMSPSSWSWTSRLLGSTLSSNTSSRSSSVRSPPRAAPCSCRRTCWTRSSTSVITSRSFAKAASSRSKRSRRSAPERCVRSRSSSLRRSTPSPSGPSLACGTYRFGERSSTVTSPAVPTASSSSPHGSTCSTSPAHPPTWRTSSFTTTAT